MYTRLNRVPGTRSYTLCYSTVVKPDTWRSLKLMCQVWLDTLSRRAKLVNCGRYGMVEVHKDGSYRFVD